MITLDIGRLHINNPNLQNKTLDEIKLFLTQVLESDLVLNMTIKKKTRWDKVDNVLRTSKIINIESAQELGDSLTILGKESEETHHKTARDEYLTKKYN